MRIFYAFIEIFLWYDVTMLLGVVAMYLAHEIYNMGSVLTQMNTLYFYTKLINFFAIDFGIYCLDIETKFLKLGLK